MLQLVDESIEAFLRASVPPLADGVDVAFEAPDRDWGVGLTRPTVNLFLWDVRRNLDQRDAGMELIDGEDGRRHRRPPLPRVACRYLVTAWTADVGDEHRLLGALLATLLTTSELPAEHLREGLAGLHPLPSVQVALPDGNDSTDFWSALGGQLKPGLDLVVTVTVDAATLAAAGPPTDRHELILRQTNDPASSSRSLRVGGQVADPEQTAGALVRSPRGTTRVDQEGRFLVSATAGDEVVVETDPPQRQQVRARGRLRFKKGSVRGP
jgi:hypothetical protein